MPEKMDGQVIKDNTIKSQNRILCSRREWFFLFFIAIMSLLKAFGFYEGQTIFTAGLVLAFICLFLSLLSVPKTGREWGTVVVLLFIGTLVYFNTGEKSLLVNFGFLSGLVGLGSYEKGYGSDGYGKRPESGIGEAVLNRIVRTGLLCWGIGFLLLTFLALTGVIPEQIFMHDKTGIGFVVCHSLGYAHSNVLHINYLCISAMILFLVRGRCTKKQKCGITLVLFVLDLYVFLYSMSYTGFLASILFYALYLYGTFREEVGGMSKAEAILAQLVLPVCLLFSLVGPVVIRGSLFDRINAAVNTRYELTRWFLTNQPITAFGTRMEVPNYRYTLDCSYAYLFMRLGVVPFVILMVLYIGTIHQLVKESRRTELAIMLGLCIAGVTEPFLFNLSFKNVTLVFVGAFLAESLRKPREIRTSSSDGKLGSVSGSAKEDQKSNEKVAAHSIDHGPSGKEDLKDDNGSVWCMFPKWGGKAVPSKLLIADRAEASVVSAAEKFRRHRERYLLAAALTALVTCIVYMVLTKPAQIVFINDSVNEEWQSDRDSMFLSEEDVKTFEEEGNIIYGYEGPEEKMYIYTGRTAVIEYDRRVVSWGFWMAGGVFLILLAFGVHSNRKSGSESKRFEYGESEIWQDSGQE